MLVFYLGNLNKKHEHHSFSLYLHQRGRHCRLGALFPLSLKVHCSPYFPPSIPLQSLVKKSSIITRVSRIYKCGKDHTEYTFSRMGGSRSHE